MLFVTVGSQKFPFDRLLRALDSQVAQGLIREEIFAQTGASAYMPRHFPFSPYLDRETFNAQMARAEIVITHGGTGAIMGALKLGKKVIAVPRRARYGEHVDDHQLQLAAQFRAQNLIFSLEDCDRLPQALVDIRSHSFRTYRSSTQAILRDMEAYLEGLQ